jgi:acetyl/propionyl-CoA carboxylase alpha subunit
MLYHVTIGEREFRVTINGGRATVDGEPVGNTDLAALPGTALRHLILDGRSHTIAARRGTEEWDLHVDGWPVQVGIIDERTAAIRAMTGRGAAALGPKPVRAPMPGLILRIEVAVGDTVGAGQGVVAMEAMKMENELKAEGDGVVARVLVEPGQAVEKGAVLVELEAVSP